MSHDTRKGRHGHDQVNKRAEKDILFAEKFIDDLEPKQASFCGHILFVEKKSQSRGPCFSWVCSYLFEVRIGLCAVTGLGRQRREHSLLDRVGELGSHA
jgi:hypothetical protein